MVKLSVNINKIALIRNSRGKNTPNLIQVTNDLVTMGADGITLHPRPDQRHARKSDVYELKNILPIELNVEGYPSPDFMEMVLAARPAQVTLVPDKPEAITSSAGWNTLETKFFLLEIISQLKQANIRTSLFIAPDIEMIEGAAEIGTDRIELYTESYADSYATDRENAVEAYVRAAGFAHAVGLEVNAGHDLNLENLSYFVSEVPHLKEVSIGHALVCDALYLGLSETIRRYKACLSPL
jgi:pyridoxine 5-phosphate synthase